MKFFLKRASCATQPVCNLANAVVAALAIASGSAAAAAEKIDWDNLPAIFQRRYEERAPDRFHSEEAGRSRSLQGFRIDPVVTSTWTRTTGTRADGLGGTTKSTEYDVLSRLSQTSPYGTELAVTHDQVRDDVSDHHLSVGTSTIGSTIGAEISQKLLKGGPFFGSTTDDAADLNYQLAILNSRTRFEDLLFEALSALAGVEEADLSLAAARRAEATALDQAKAVEGLVQSGYKPKADLLVSEQATILATQGVRDAEGRATVAHRRLDMALFQTEGDESLAVTPDDETKSDEILAARLAPLKAVDWSQEAPKVQSARLAAEAARLAAKEARREDLPDLAVHLAVNKPSTGGDLERTVGVSISVPLRSAITRDASTLAGLKSFEADSELARVTREFSNDKQTYEEKKNLAERTYVASKRLQELAQKTLIIEQQKYADGKSTIADVRRVQEDLDGAAQNLLRARTALLIAYLNAAKAVGRLALVTNGVKR